MTPQMDPKTVCMRRMKVSFDEDEDIIRGVQDSWDYSSAEARRIWYQPSDYAFFKRTVGLIAKDAIDQGMDKSLNNTYDCSDEVLVQGRLKRWCRHGIVCRGLERWIHRTSSIQRKTDAIHRTRMVLETQEKLKGRVSAEYLALEIATLSASCSSIHRRYALFMGRADDYAVHATRAADHAVRAIGAFLQGKVDRNGLPTNEAKEETGKKEKVGRKLTIYCTPFASPGIHFLGQKMLRYKIQRKAILPPAC